MSKELRTIPWVRPFEEPFLQLIRQGLSTISKDNFPGYRSQCCQFD